MNIELKFKLTNVLDALSQEYFIDLGREVA